MANSKTYILIDYYNNIYSFINSSSDILNFYKSLGGILTNCSSLANNIHCDDTSKLIPHLSLVKISGVGVIVNNTKVLSVTNSTSFLSDYTTPTRLSGGISSTVKITERGSGYLTAPSLSISAPDVAGGIPAIASCTIFSGYVSTITVSNNGTGYTAPGIVTFSDPFIGSAWTTGGSAVLNSNYYYISNNKKNWYKCTQAGVFGTVGPVNISGVADNGTTKLSYIGTTAKAETSYVGATVKAYMDISTLPVDQDGYLIDIFLVNLTTKEKVKIKFTSGNSLCI